MRENKHDISLLQAVKKFNIPRHILLYATKINKLTYSKDSSGKIYISSEEVKKTLNPKQIKLKEFEITQVDGFVGRICGLLGEVKQFEYLSEKDYNKFYDGLLLIVRDLFEKISKTLEEKK